MTELNDSKRQEIEQGYAQKAAELGLKTPRLPFASLCMDNQPYRAERWAADKPDDILPDAFALDMQFSRLNQMGKMWSNKGCDWDHNSLLEFVDGKGSYHLARDVPANREALEAAGFQFDWYQSTSFMDGSGLFPAGENKTRLETILSTPCNIYEKRLHAVTRGDSLAEVEALLKQEKIPLEHEDRILGELMSKAINSTGAARDAIVKHLLESQETYAMPLALHEAMKSAAPSQEIIPAISAVISPFKKDELGTPAFLYVNPAKKTARKELRLVVGAMLQSDGVSEPDKSFIRAQHDIIDAALMQVETADSSRHEDTLKHAFAVVKSLRDAWQEAHKFGEEEYGKIPPRVKTFLEPLVSGKRRERFMETLLHSKLSVSMVDDLVKEFTRHVVLPMVLIDYARQTETPLNDEALHALQKTLDHQDLNLMHRLVPLVKEKLFKGRSLDQIIGLNEAWHDTRVAFPDALKPVKAPEDSVWHSLFTVKELKVPGMPGIVIHALTSGRELAHEGSEEVMHHCVGKGSYTSECLEGKTHIFSIRKDGEPKPLATLGGHWNKRKFAIFHNKGYRNADPGEEAERAAEWLKKQLESGKIKTSEKLGETEESKKTNRPQLLRTVGFELTQANVNAAFAEFCHNERRRMRHYNSETGNFDIINRDIGLIVGNHIKGMRVENGKTITDKVYYKDMPADAWFDLTGLRRTAMAFTLQPLIDHTKSQRLAVKKEEGLSFVRREEARENEQPQLLRR